MYDPLVSDDEFCIGQVILAGIMIPIMIRKIAAGNLQSDAMSFLKATGGGAQSNLKFDGLIRYQEVFRLQPVTMPGAYHSVTYIDGLPVRILIDKPGKEVRIRCG